MGDIAGPSCSEGDGAWIVTKTICDNELKRVDDKVDITMSDKINKTPVLVRYQLNV